MVKQRRVKLNSSDKENKSQIYPGNAFKMRPVAAILFVLLVMIVIVTIPYITYSNEASLETLFHEDKRKGDWEEIQETQFSNISDFPITYTKKFTNRKRVFDKRSKLDIKALFIGVKKCGTTTMKVFAGAHPDIIVANTPHVCRPKPYKSYREIEKALEATKANKKVVLVENNECLHNIRYFDRLKRPKKIVLLLCDPTLRAYSDYKHIVRIFAYKEAFEQIVPKALSLITAHQDDVNFGEYMSNFRYEGHLDYSIVSVGVYYEYLKEYYKRYKPEDILILSGAELKQKPHFVMNQLESFLGVSHYLNRSKFVKNTATGFYCIKLSEVNTRCIGLSKTQKFPPPDLATLEKLKTLYHPYNEKLYRLINRTFAWV